MNTNGHESKAARNHFIISAALRFFVSYFGANEKYFLAFFISVHSFAAHKAASPAGESPAMEIDDESI